MRPLVIIESPFRGEGYNEAARKAAEWANTVFARACVRDSVLRGEAPIASHLLFTQTGILKDDVPEERVLGIDCGLAWSRVCDYHAFYTDRGWSGGMKYALEHCFKNATLWRIRGLTQAPILPNYSDDFLRRGVWINGEFCS